MNIYIDLGNTNLKIGFLINEKWKFFTFSLKDNEYILKFEKILLKNIFKEAWISSVNAKHFYKINMLIKKYDIKVCDSKDNWNIKTLVDDNSELGSDILANTAFASLYGDNVILFSIGTALVISYIKNKILQGVSIFPGIQSQLKILSIDTQGIGLVVLNNNFNILGKNTVDAVSAGVINSYKHIINGFVKDIDPNAKIIITGGGSKLLESHINHDVIEFTVIKGLYEISKNR